MHLCVQLFALQLDSCKDELLRFLEKYVVLLGKKVLPYAADIKVCEKDEKRPTAGRQSASLLYQIT